MVLCQDLVQVKMRFESVALTKTKSGIQYSLNNQTALCVFLGDGEVLLDNNVTEGAPVSYTHLSTEGRDPIDDIYKINKELEAYDPELMKRPQVIAANKIDAVYEGDEDPVQKIRDEFEPQGCLLYTSRTGIFREIKKRRKEGNS